MKMSWTKTQLFQVSLTQCNCLNAKPNIMVLNENIFLSMLCPTIHFSCDLFKWSHLYLYKGDKTHTHTHIYILYNINKLYIFIYIHILYIYLYNTDFVKALVFNVEIMFQFSCKAALKRETIRNRFSVKVSFIVDLHRPVSVFSKTCLCKSTYCQILSSPTKKTKVTAARNPNCIGDRNGEKTLG